MTQSLLEAVMALPPEERAELAERLWESLPLLSADSGFAEDLAKEVRSRRESHIQEGSLLPSWGEVRRELDEIVSKFDRS